METSASSSLLEKEKDIFEQNESDGESSCAEDESYTYESDESQDDGSIEYDPSGDMMEDNGFGISIGSGAMSMDKSMGSRSVPIGLSSASSIMNSHPRFGDGDGYNHGHGVRGGRSLCREEDKGDFGGEKMMEERHAAGSSTSQSMMNDGKGGRNRSRSNSYSMDISSSPYESSEFLSSTSMDVGNLRKKGRSSPFQGNNIMSSSSSSSFSILAKDKVFCVWVSLCKEMAEVLCISDFKAQSLLKYSRWNKEKLMLDYFADPERLCEKAGVKHYDSTLQIIASKTNPELGSTDDCGNGNGIILMEEKENEKIELDRKEKEREESHIIQEKGRVIEKAKETEEEEEEERKSDKEVEITKQGLRRSARRGGNKDNESTLLKAEHVPTSSKTISRNLKEQQRESMIEEEEEEQGQGKNSNNNSNFDIKGGAHKEKLKVEQKGADEIKGNEITSVSASISTSTSSKISKISKTSTSTSTSKSISVKNQHQSYFCDICRGHDDEEAMITLGCGHYYHLTCIGQYIKTQVKDGCISIKCPEFFNGCKEIVTTDVIQYLAEYMNEKDTIFNRYQNFLINNFIECSPTMIYCPGKGCELVGFSNSRPSKVCCPCGMEYCFKCGIECHVPASCEQMKAWNEKCAGESENVNWILANTEECPNRKCNKRIEKNQGCNHMTCSQCRHEFCWMCKGPWSEHGQNTGGYYKCNKLAKENAQNAQKNRATKDLNRYLHFYKFYDNHNKSQDFAAKELKETKKAIQETRGQNQSFFDASFLVHANEQLIQCRRVLKSTYVYGYYLTDGDKNGQDERREALFTDQQDKLESFTDELSELCEQTKKIIYDDLKRNLKEYNDNLPKDEEKLNETEFLEQQKTKVINKYRVTNAYITNIVDYLDEVEVNERILYKSTYSDDSLSSV